MYYVHVLTVLVWHSLTFRHWKERWAVSWWNYRVSKNRNVSENCCRDLLTWNSGKLSTQRIVLSSSVDNRLRDILAVESGAASADSVAADTVAVAQASAISAADSLAAALKGETASNSAAMEQMKKEHPLASVLQLNPNGYGSVVGYADYKDTAQVNQYLAMKEVKEMLPKDLRLKWGVKAADFDKQGRIFELYAIKSTERNGRAPLEGDVITDAKDEYDQFNKPCVSMSMNTDGARRWAVLTKNNVGKAIAIVLDGYVYSAPNVNGEITGGHSQITGNFTPEVTKTWLTY